ncbi:hypothetical protein [Enterobacter hormaechei]
MATTPTNLPVPSESYRDLKFNSGKIDEFVTSMGWTYTDRFGNKHYTIEGINYLAQQAMAAFGYVILTGKSFTTGATINNPNEVLLNDADGEYYKWTGSFASGPKVVPENSSPESTGGIGPGFWVGVGDASLRSALAAEEGYKLIGGLEARLSVYDIAAADGDRNSDQLNSVFAEFKGTPVKIYSSMPLTFTIDKETTLYGDFDLSNCTFNLAGGKIVYADERDASAYIKDFTPSTYPLNELKSTLTFTESTTGWDNSLVKMSGTELDL